MTQARIQDIATKLRVHPIHIRALFSTQQLTAHDCTIDSILQRYHAYVRENKPKPFVKWVGGKRQLLDQFKSNNLYPPFAFNPDHATYFEPFVGGGAMFFDLSLRKAVISDMNAELITTYRVIKEDVYRLIGKLKNHQRQNSKEHFLFVRAQNLKKLSDSSIAARFIYLNRTGFNGLYRVNRRGQFNVPYGRYHNPLICDEENLLKVSAALKNTKIFHEDYKKVLTRAKKGDFIYFDPPYYPVSKTANFTSYTAEGFLEKEQKELRDVFVALHERGCYVMLSNSDTPFINELYSSASKDVTIHKVFAGRAINAKSDARGKISEVVITNYF